MAEDNMATETVVARRTASPYDLNSSDTPGNIITQVQLKGENFDEWARAIRTSLRARRKWGFIDGTHKQPPTNSARMDDWWTVNSMLVSWILNTIAPNLRSIVSYKENAKELWDDLEERFSVTNGPRIQQLKSELADTKQRGLTILDYYGKLKSLWEALGSYDPVPSCTCAGCTCGVNDRLQKQKEEAMVHQFLMGLDDDMFATIRSTLLALDPLPTLNKVYSSLIQEECVRNMQRTTDSGHEQMALTTAARFRGKSKWDSNDRTTVCTHCNRTGHVASGCFKLVGYPDW